MRIRVLLFAAHRELVGTSRLELEIGEKAAVQDLYDAIQDMFPDLENLRASTTFAVNRAVVTTDTRLQEGDEVAFLQPVSGGCGD